MICSRCGSYIGLVVRNVDRVGGFMGFVSGDSLIRIKVSFGSERSADIVKKALLDKEVNEVFNSDGLVDMGLEEPLTWLSYL